MLGQLSADPSHPGTGHAHIEVDRTQDLLTDPHMVQGAEAEAHMEAAAGA